MSVSLCLPLSHSCFLGKGVRTMRFLKSSETFHLTAMSQHWFVSLSGHQNQLVHFERSDTQNSLSFNWSEVGPQLSAASTPHRRLRCAASAENLWCQKGKLTERLLPLDKGDWNEWTARVTNTPEPYQKWTQQDSILTSILTLICQQNDYRIVTKHQTKKYTHPGKNIESIQR